MENSLMVSVIIVVKNGERYLTSAIKSVLNQDYHPVEIIVVDGQSEDRTAQIAKSFGQVRYILQVNKGISDGYNVGINVAKGQIIAFLSHDDFWTFDKLTSQVEYMIQHPEVQYTIAKFIYFLEPGSVSPAGFRKELLKGEHVGRIMETLVARKSVFEEVGKFDTQLNTAEDVDWYSRASDQQIPMAVIPKVLLHKRIHGTNISLNVDANNQNLLKALRQSVHRKCKGKFKEK